MKRIRMQHNLLNNINNNGFKLLIQNIFSDDKLGIHLFDIEEIVDYIAKYIEEEYVYGVTNKLRVDNMDIVRISSGTEFTSTSPIIFHTDKNRYSAFIIFNANDLDSIEILLV